MNAILEQINSAGLKFVEFALPMLVQSVVLIVILLLADFAMRKKVRAVFRYWIWLLVLVKLILPASLSSPLSLGHFFGDRLTYVDRTETPSEPQANLIEPVPVNVPPFIDLADIDTDRFKPAVPSPIAVTEQAKEPTMTSPAAPPAISVTPLSWRGAVFLVWLTAVFAMILLLLQRAIFVRGLVAQAKEANGSMVDMLESCRASISVKRKLVLKISANAASPAVCGLFRPVILVPQNLALSLTANQLKAVLLHELAHIRRGDLFVNLVQTFLQIIYFYNPLLWLANCIIRRIREQAVDEMVLVAMGEKAPQYPQTLVSVAKLAFKPPVLSLRLIGVVESKNALSGRIKHILNRPIPKRAKIGIVGLVVVVITGAVLLPMANSMSDSPKLVIKGVVKDAQTNEPIAGAKAFDDGYAHEPLWEQIRPDQRSQWGAITNSAGRYSFLTWPEHHTIKVEAPGYKAQRRNLYKGHFVFKTKDEEIFDFNLEPEKASDSSRSKISQPENDSTDTNRKYFWQTNIRQTRETELLKTLNEDIEPFEERVGFYVRDYDDGVIHCIDFDNNKIIRVPDKLDINDRNATLKWTKENNVDAMFRRASSLVSLDMASVIVSDSEWKRLSDNTLEKLGGKAAGSTDMLYSSGNGTMLHAFKTSQGRIGVLKLTSVENKGLDYRLLLIKYKLLKTDVQVDIGDSESSTDIRKKGLANPRKVFSVYGIVTDERGNPLPDVKVSASCGRGTLFRTGETITGENGHYELYFGPGIRFRIKDTDPWGAGFQAATIYAQKSGLYEANLCQHGHLAMSGRADYADYYEKQMKYYKGVVLPDKPYRLDFVMLPAATIRGKLIDKKGSPVSSEEIWLAGNELYPSTSALETIQTDKDGMFTVDSVPCKSFWFTHRYKRDEVKTRSINFSQPGEYEITLVYDKPVFGRPTLTCTSVKESQAGQKPNVQVEDKKKKPSVWLALLPRSPIRSAKELYLYFWGSPLVSDQIKIDSFELEIRSAKENVRMVRIDCKSMITVHSSKGEVLQWSMFRDGLRENMIRRIGPLEDGEYLIAIYVNGIRSSNVAEFTVDSSFDSSNEPTLQVVPLVPVPGKKLQYFGLRATGPTPQDSELTNMALHFTDIIVDGVPRKILARNWSGPVYPLKPGQQHEEILLLKYYKPEIDLSRKHTVKAVVGKYESAPIEIGFDYSLELAWDEATTTIKSRPPRPPVLEGRVIGPDGKPGIDYRVCLYADTGRNQYIEYSDKDGEYDFPNVPTGRYKLTCQPKGNSEPTLTFEQFQIEANNTVVQELSLEGKYAFSGKVTYEDGSPAADVKIVGRWEMGGGNVFRDLRVTNEIGYYELAAPFELARYIGLSIFTPEGTPAQGSYQHMRVMGPRTDVDFVVKRREIHAAIWPKKFARLGGKHPDFQPVPVPEGWDYLRLLQALYKHLEIQCKAKFPDYRATLKDEVIELSFNTRDYNIIRPGNAKRTGMRRNNDRGIGPEPDGLILTVHFSKIAGQFDRPHIVDRSPWTGFISQVYLPDIKLYLNVDIQYGTGINEKLLTDLCAPTSWLKTIFNNFNKKSLEQKAWGDAVEKGSRPDVQAESEIHWVIEDYGQTRLLSDKEKPDIDKWVSIWGGAVKNKGRYLVPDEDLTLKALMKAAGYNKDKLPESYVELIRRSQEGNITTRSTYSRNLKTLLSGEESDIVLKTHDAVSSGYIEPSANGVEFWSGYHFGDIVEMTVNDDGAKVNMFADLDSSKLITPPDTLNYDDVNAVLRWIKDNGIDVMGETAPAVHGLVGFNMYAARVDNYFWNADPREVTDRLMVRIDDPVLLRVENRLPVTYLIKTSKYKMGILQILGFTENPKGINIRYKLLNKGAAPKTDVLLTPEPVAGDWQYIGQSIPPDFNDIMTLTEHINLGSIGHDAEGKIFITFVRDGQEDRNRQYRFVLFTKNGDILEPDGHIVLGEGKRSEEKFTFDEPFITRQLKGFRFQARPSPPSGVDDISSQLQKPASVVEAGTLLPSNLPPPGRYAVELDGIDDYLLVPDSPSLRLEPPFTIEMWIKTKLPPDASEYRGGWAVISKGFTVGTPRAYLTGFGINIQRFPREPSNLHIDFCKANNSGTYSATYTGYPLTNGVSDWIHITHVFDGEYYKSTPGHPLVMGKFLIPINDPFKGLLGEVRLWNGARTRQELRQYKNIALTGNEPGLAACWTFEQTEGQYAYDISGNNNHARLGKFTGPDDADPKWIELQAPSPKPDLKTDAQVEDKKRNTEISGFVVDENGSPIAGATVTLSNKDLALLPKPERIGQTMRMIVFDNFYDITDTNGRFEFLDFNPGKTDIVVKSQGYRTEILREITTGTKNLRITLGKPSTYILSGKVIDGKGNPISGVEITLAEESYTTVRTDEKGTFRFAEILEPTAVHRARALFARKEGFGIWGKTLDATGGETYVKITLLPEEKISGLVVDQVGRPITNATVLFWSCRDRDTRFSFSSKWMEIAPRTGTDANGRFTLTGIPTESDVFLRASAPGYASSGLYGVKTGEFGSYAVMSEEWGTIEVYGSNREPAETVEFKLQKAVTLIGTLTYEDSGRPAPGLKIATQSHKASQWAETKTDQAGRFKLEGVSPNPCNLLVLQEDLKRDSLPQWTAAAIVFNNLQEGETRSGIRLVLTKGGIIRGKVIDAKGNPLHRIDIAFYSAARPRPGAACQSILTAEDGSWAYRFPPGDVYVYIRTKIPEGKWSKKIYNLHLDDGQVIENIDFELSQMVPENSPYRRDIAR